MHGRELLTAHRSEIERLARKHGASRIRVFGSVAHNAGHADSDIDFLVDLEPGRSLLDQIALQQDLEALLGRSVDLVLEGGISPHLEQRIHSEAVPL